MKSVDKTNLLVQIRQESIIIIIITRYGQIHSTKQLNFRLALLPQYCFQDTYDFYVEQSMVLSNI
ncbi:hypothetical protein pb186bvf_009861 [Paramecium bursaria]